MFAEECRRAIAACQRTGLDALSREVWRAYGADVLTEAEASEMCEAIAARRAVPAPAQSRRSIRAGSRPRSSTSMERRRAWTASGWLPPAVAARFTMGEAAAIGVVMAEVAATGRCELPVGAIAGRAGVCATTVRNAVREARGLGLIAVEERRVAYDRSLPNVITILSRDLALWVRTRARVERQGGGCRTAAPTTNHHLPILARPVASAGDKGIRGKETRLSRPKQHARFHGRHRVA